MVIITRFPGRVLPTGVRFAKALKRSAGRSQRRSGTPLKRPIPLTDRRICLGVVRSTLRRGQANQ